MTNESKTTQDEEYLMRRLREVWDWGVTEEDVNYLACARMILNSLEKYDAKN